MDLKYISTVVVSVCVSLLVSLNGTAQILFPCDTSSALKKYEEDFDAGQGNWTGDFGTANGEFQFETGTTTSGSTGPSGPHSGSQYIYYEASSTGSPGSATIVSPAIDLTGVGGFAVLTFWIHAYGADIPGGMLDIAVGTSSSGPFTNVYSRTFSSQLQSSENDPYVQDTADLSNYVNQTVYLEITFTTDPNASFNSDLALDMFEIWGCAGSDAGIDSIVSPGVPNCLDSNLTVDITTMSPDTLTSANVHWSLNGVYQDSFSWTGSLQPFSTTSQPVHVATHDFKREDEIKVWITMPNGNQDDIPSNDTAEYKIPVFELSDIPEEQILCQDSTLELNTNADFAKQVWSSGEETRSIHIDEPGIYSVTTTDIFSGCEAVYETRVAGQRELVTTESPVMGCEGETIPIETNLSEGTFTWSTGDNTPDIQVYGEGAYWVEVTDTSGTCTASDTVEVEYLSEPEADFDAVIGWLTIDFENESDSATEFYWQFGDGGTSQAESPARAYQENGEYTVTLVASNECFSDTATRTFSVDDQNTTSIETNNEKEYSLEIYPNPTEGQFRVEMNTYSSQVSNDLRIEVIDTRGSVIRSIQMDDPEGNSFSRSINLNSPSKGMYFIKVIEDDRQITVEKLIVR